MPLQSAVLLEARRLYALGAAVHWLHPKSKRPIDTGWTTGERKSWDQLVSEYRPGMNVGVRLGAPSKMNGGYLALIDLDIKTKNPALRAEAEKAAENLLKGIACPIVDSGRGLGSRHFYGVTDIPLTGRIILASEKRIKCFMPSAKPSKKEWTELTSDEISKGIRIRKAWEIGFMGDGQQVVVPPSIHPDSGEPYRWAKSIEKEKALSKLPVSTALLALPSGKVLPVTTALQDFTLSPVELAWLPNIPDDVLTGITKETNVTDRSAFLLRAAAALFAAGLNRNEVLTVLTDPENAISNTSYQHAGDTRSRKAAANWLYRYTVSALDPTNVFARAPLPARKLSAEEQKAQALEFQADRHWRQDIVRTQHGIPQKLVNNVILIMENAVSPDVVRRDEFAYRDSYSCNTPWGGKQKDVVSDDDVDESQSWLGKHFGFEPPKNIIESALVVIARRNAYDPVKDFLDGLPEWDGVGRLNTWLIRNFEAEGHPEYLAQVFRKWMTAMVMRGYRPGAKFDWMPIFEGTQGIGKSSFGRLLVGDKYFLDWLPNLNDKDAALSLQGMWGVEMGELSQFRGNALENIKAFITRTVDKIRPPYGKRLIESARRCVFFGTTNRGKYLIDETGNRRFKPVEVGRLNFEALKRDRLQLFSEARSLLLSEKETERSLELDGTARIYENQIHQRKMVEDDSYSMEETMRNFVERVYTGTVNFDLDKFKIIDLFEGVGPFAGWRKENLNFQFAAKMLTRMGCKDRMVRGRKHWKIEKDDFF